MDELQEKIEYCLNCKAKPCSEKGCPLGNDIPSFIAYAKQGEYKKAYEVLCKTTVMPFICGKICPKSRQCQSSCVRGIKGKPVSIGDIESAIGNIAIDNKWYLDVEKEPSKSEKIAVIGAGPAGITASIILARKGYNVTTYEKQEKIGGILRYGIPNFRLNKTYIDILEEQMRYLGVKIKTSNMLGRDVTIEQLLKEYNAIFLSEGANESLKMGIQGEELPYVIGANELLENGNHPNYKGKKVIVIGGGNVAMDVSRTIKKLGADEVTVVYRRARVQMPAENGEVEEAIKEGVKFLFQINVKKIEKEKAYCVRTMLVKKEGETREIPVEIPNSEFILDANYIIMAIGSKLKQVGVKDIKLNEKGYIQIDENYETNIKNVYAAGDNIGKNATVAWACRYARDAVEKINKNIGYTGNNTDYAS